jgi:serine protease Do
MGRVAILLFSFLSSDSSEVLRYDPVYDRNLHVFAETSLKKSYKSSLIITAFNSEGEMSGGSGNYFKVYRKKFILTALHVVEGAKEVFVTDKGGMVYKATVRHRDPLRDIAILTVEEQIKYAKAVEYRIPQGFEVGKSISYCGNPEGHFFTCYSGMVSGTSGGSLLADIFAWPGSSGSVVFDNAGRVVGILSAVPVSAPTGVPVLIPRMVRISPMFHLSQDKIWEVLDV